jgi:dTDP-4-dehydrorhamnose reductase
MANTWLITGAYGQLGRALAAGCASRGLSCKGRDLDTLDIGDADAVDEWILGARPQVVVNCAAFTAVDDCEVQPDLAMRVNGTAVGHLAAACNQTGARLVQVSTDYVFPGSATEPIRESTTPAPVGAYGRTKAAGEAKIAAANPNHFIVRTAWLYGHGGQHFVAAIRRQIDDGARTLRVVADQRGSPTFCDDLAQAIVDLVESGAAGVVHAVNAGGTSWHGFAEEIVRLVGAEVEVVPVATSEYPRPAPRPAYSVLDAARLERLLQRKMPPWQDALRRYLVGP